MADGSGPHDRFDREWIVFGPQSGYSVESADAEGLYLIYCHDPRSVKVGISGSPLRRISTLNMGSPTRLYLMFYTRLLGRVAEGELHRVLEDDRQSGEWFSWTPRVQGFLLGVVFGISGVLQVSWPFASYLDSDRFGQGVDWAHGFLDPDERHTLLPMTGMGGEEMVRLFTSWSDMAKERRRKERES